jgi:glycosyltransferase involved in cell wall biosynthesis
MRIVINGRFLTQSVTGVQRYAIEVIKHLDQKIEEEELQGEFILLVPRNFTYLPNLKQIKIVVHGCYTGQLWEQIDLPRYVENRFLVNLSNTYPLILKNQIVTIHDAAVFGTPNAYAMIFRNWYKILIKLARYKTKGVLTVSDFSKNELIRYGSMKLEQINSVYIGADHMNGIEEDESIMGKHDLQDKTYILAVSSINKRKNFAVVAEALKLKKIKNI